MSDIAISIDEKTALLAAEYMQAQITEEQTKIQDEYGNHNDVSFLPADGETFLFLGYAENYHWEYVCFKVNWEGVPFEATGSHCSCNGFDDPDFSEVSWEYVTQRVNALTTHRMMRDDREIPPHITVYIKIMTELERNKKNK